MLFEVTSGTPVTVDSIKVCADSDGDSYSDAYEALRTTIADVGTHVYDLDPFSADSDSDGLNDNVEVSSYGTNRRYLETKGYHCTMRTDTEVMAYAADLLMRRHGLTPKQAALVMASPLWNEIEVLPEEEQRTCQTIRQTYGPLLMNGPFTVIIARSGELIGLGDRIRLRPLTAAIAGPMLYVSSEIAAVHLIERQVEAVWTPFGGEPVIGRLGEVPECPRAVPKRVARIIEEPTYG